MHACQWPFGRADLWLASKETRAALMPPAFRRRSDIDSDAETAKSSHGLNRVTSTIELAFSCRPATMQRIRLRGCQLRR